MGTTFEKNCPSCGCVINYSNKYNLKKSLNNNSDCKKCSSKKNRPEGFGEFMSNRVKGKNNPMYGMFGNKNPFYGKKHSKETIEKIKKRNISTYKTKEFKEKMSKLNKGEKNPMYGKNFYEIWLNKYGENIANEKLIEFKEKLSKKSSGNNNPMFGKPSPKKSGNGWSGWYKGWFFRSLLELSYMIFVIERFNLNWESGETNKYVIKYCEDNTYKNYFPDFIINEKYVVECKPKSLQKTSKNKLKFIYAEKYCLENNLIFKIRNVPKINKDELKELINNNLIVLTDKWKNKIL